MAVDTTPVTFPNAAVIILAHLRARLPAMTFAHDVPNPRPDEFVRVFRTGGPKATLVSDAAQISVESWAVDGDVAYRNAMTVRAHLNDMAGRVVDGVQCYKIDEFAGPGELPDPLSTQRRVTWTIAVHLRGT